jgi:hypothetical protein
MKKLRANSIQRMSATIQFILFGIPGIYLTMQRLNYTNMEKAA